jgi:PAS domain S-box-containing protein
VEFDAENEPVRLYGIMQDITERKRMEAELRVKERAIACAISAIGMTDPEGKLLYVNDALVKMWGYESADDILGRLLPEFWEGEGIYETLKALHEKGSHQGEDIGKKKDGSLFHVEFTANMIEGEVGKPEYLFGSFTDITKRKDAELMFSGLLHSAPDAMVVVNDEGNIQLVNEQAEKLFGYAREELIEMGVECLIPEIFRGKHVDFRIGSTEAPKIRHKAARLQLFALRRDGSEFPIDVSLNAMNTREGVLMIAAVRDVTERKQAEQSLRDSRKRLIQAEQVAHTGFLDWDLKTNEIVWSRGVYELYGIDPDTPVTVEQTLGLVHPDDRELAKENLDMAVRGLGDFSIDHRVVRPDGKVLWVHARAHLERDSEGKPATLMGTVVDITARKLAEEELKHSEERFRNLMKQSPLAIEILTPEGQIAQVNAAWKRLWGLTEEETARVLAKYNMLTDQQVKDAGIAPLVERAFAGEPVVLPPIQYSGRRAADEMGLEDLEARSPWVQCHLYPVKDANGDVAYVVNTYMDITDLKLAEREAREQRDALARRLTPREHEVMTYVISGVQNKQIAAELGIAEATVKVHRGRVMRKLGISSVADVVRICEKAGIAPANSRRQ